MSPPHDCPGCAVEDALSSCSDAVARLLNAEGEFGEALDAVACDLMDLMSELEDLGIRHEQLRLPMAP
ncbi:MAG: hypothetical protein HRJ53_11775 [Acidobacteria bacterium Pan2503]|uniref:Uncharacterized protein n=1 Tax=Candidatus Acidiferrum panamense TaxID=2741543 RepID=A0A7V8SX89_9BACT|nr:hypothetical protein [Candidatus Acidoferrum panamensis]